MKKMQNMGGFFVAAVTPFDEQGKFSAPALHKLMDKTNRRGAKRLSDRRQQRGNARCSRMRNAWRGCRPPRNTKTAQRRS